MTLDHIHIITYEMYLLENALIVKLVFFIKKSNIESLND